MPDNVFSKWERKDSKRDKDVKLQIKVGYGLLIVMACFFVAQLYLAFRGNIVSYGGAVVALICWYAIWGSINKLKRGF